MNDKSSEKNINHIEDNDSIPFKLSNVKNKFEEAFSNELSKITKLINYLEKLSLELNQISLNFYNDKIKPISPKEDINNSFYSSFYLFHNQIFESFKNLSEKITKEIIPSLSKTKKLYEKENKKSLLALEDIINQLTLHQDVLNLIKKEYYDECKKLEAIEQNNKNENSKNNKTQDEIMQKMSNQTKIMENKFSLYKKEVEVMKKLCSDCERDFDNMKQKLQENEIKKNNYIYTIINNYLVYFIDDMRIINDEEDAFQNFLDEYKKMFIKTNLIEDICGNKILWKYDFDISNSNNKNKNEITNKIDELKIKEEEEENNKNKGPLKFEELIIMPNSLYEINGININYMELKRNIYERIKTKEDDITKKFSIELLGIKDFFKTLFSNDIIQSEQKNILMNILEKYQGNVNCYIKFCDKILYSNRDNNEEIFEFMSFSNFAYLSGLLKNIIENISENLLRNDISSYKLFDKIICLGEKVMYKDTYLCELLSTENQIFKKDVIWKNGLKNKLVNLLEDMCKKESNNAKSKEGKYFMKGFEAFGKLFQRRDSKVKGKPSLIEFYELHKQIKIYKELNKQALKKINDIFGQNIIHETIKCYIRHMINYDFLNTSEKKEIELDDIFNKILTDYSIKDDLRTQFLKLYFNSNIYSIKKPKTSFKTNLQKKLYYGQKDESNIFIIKKCSKYLNIKDKILLLNINSKYLTLNKYIFHQYLKQDTNFNSKNRIGIWKILLKYKEAIKKYDYDKIITEVNKVPINEKEGSDFLIMMDIKRTKFKSKENNGQKILCNLIRSLFYNENNKEAKDEDKIIYCQGMNFISAIFYDIVQNEKETFYLLKSFFINGKYETIFKNRLSLLKEYFIILEKLIFLFLPKIHQKLTHNQVHVNVFISPYFVTLFTNIYYLHMDDDANKFLLHCIDDFILNGWCSVFSTIICILKYFERKILDLKAEELIKFLVNDMGKNDLFTDEKYKIFYKLKKQYWISNELLKKLHEEIRIEKEIKTQFGENEDENS